MGKGISIGIASETKEFMTGVKTGIISPLENASDVLMDLAQTGDRAGTEIGKGVDKATDAMQSLNKTSDKSVDDIEAGMRDAVKATNKYEAAIKEAITAQKNAGTSSKASTQQAASTFTQATTEQKIRSKEAMDEIGNEAKANASEVFSSFNGSTMSFVDGIQGTLGGLVSSLGPVGFAVGAAGAVGIGLIVAALQNADTVSQEFKDSVGELTTELIETGQIGTISLDHILEKLKTLAAKEDDQKQSLTTLSKLAKTSGTSYEDLARAYAGSGDELAKVSASGAKHLKVLTDQKDAVLDSLAADKSAALGINEKIVAQTSINTYLSDAKKLTDEAAASAVLYAEAGGPAMQLKVDLIKQVDGAYDEAAGAADDYIDKESGLFDTGKYIAAMDAKKKALQDYQQTLNESGLSPAAKTFLESQGADAAATLLSGYKTGSADQKNALARIWDEAGGASSGAFTAAVQNGIKNTAITMPVYKIPAPDTTSFDKAMKDLASKRLDITITAHSRAGVQIL